MAESIGAKQFKECSALRSERHLFNNKTLSLFPSESADDGVDELFESATRAAVVVRDSDAARRRPSNKNSGLESNLNEKKRKRSSAYLDEVTPGEKKSSCCIIL